MSEIVKTEAIVLRKINHGDSSKIFTLLTPDFGKISVIAKGIKSPKSKMNARLEIFNNVEIVFYKKESREVQMVTSADTIKIYRNLTENLEKYKYASSAIELVVTLLPDHEKHELLYKGLLRILDLIDSSAEDPKILFLKFMIFFISEIGYALELSNCGTCSSSLIDSGKIGYNFIEGFMCENCTKDHMISFELSKELFNLLICLSSKQKLNSYKERDPDFLIVLLEKHLSYHIDEFKGLKSLRSF